MNHYIEELSINAQPCMQTMLYDGWVLRFNNSYTKRANSVNPLYPSDLELALKVDKCEQIYTSQKLPTVFKLTDRTDPAQLDDLLDSRGYSIDGRTIVMTLDLSGAYTQNSNIRFANQPHTEWTEHYIRLNSISARHKETLEKMLDSIIPASIYALMELEGQVIGVGLGVIENGHVGIFDIIINKECRGHGYGRHLLNGLLSEAKKRGAEKSYLQVVADNHPAVNLYTSLGYKEQYRYWYRVKDLISFVEN